MPVPAAEALRCPAQATPESSPTARRTPCALPRRSLVGSAGAAALLTAPGCLWFAWPLSSLRRVHGPGLSRRTHAPAGRAAAEAAHVCFPGDKERCSMRKAELVRRIAEELGCTQGQADEAVAAILTTIKEALRDGEPMFLRRFGTWQVRAKRARLGRNPETGHGGRDYGTAGGAFVVSRTLKQAVAAVGSPRTEPARQSQEHRDGGATVTRGTPRYISDVSRHARGADDGCRTRVSTPRAWTKPRSPARASQPPPLHAACRPCRPPEADTPASGVSSRGGSTSVARVPAVSPERPRPARPDPSPARRQSAPQDRP